MQVATKVGTSTMHMVLGDVADFLEAMSDVMDMLDVLAGYLDEACPLLLRVMAAATPQTQEVAVVDGMCHCCNVPR